MAGESYAGKYLSWLGSLISNQTYPLVNLKGIMFGNAWVYPLIQTLSHPTFLVENMYSSKKKVGNVTLMLQQYEQLVNNKSWNASFALEEQIVKYLQNETNITNIYNVRYSYEVSDINSDRMTEYLNAE